MPDPAPTLNSLLAKIGDLRASGLHLKVGSPPTFRVSGELVMSDYPSVSAEEARLYAEEMMSDAARVQYESEGDVDFAFGRVYL